MRGVRGREGLELGRPGQVAVVRFECESGGQKLSRRRAVAAQGVGAAGSHPADQRLLTSGEG